MTSDILIGATTMELAMLECNVSTTVTATSNGKVWTVNIYVFSFPWEKDFPIFIVDKEELNYNKLLSDVADVLDSIYSWLERKENEQAYVSDGPY